MRGPFLAITLCLFFFSGFSRAQVPPHQPGPPPGNHPRPEFHHDGGPRAHKVFSATSKDGLNWTKDGILLLSQASVPAAIVTPEGFIRLYYVDASRIPEGVNCAESRDDGKTFTVLGCTIAGRALDKALDPSIVRLPDGRYRLYYFGSEMRITMGKKHSIYSAISTDGIHFTQEKEVFNHDDLVDPDVFFNGKEWLMYVMGRGQTVIGKSGDGLSFTYVGPMDPQGMGTTAPVKLSDGRFRLYAFTQHGENKVVSFISADGLSWQQEDGVRLMPGNNEEITDPFVVRLKDGTWKMFYKVQKPHQQPGAGNMPRPGFGPK